MIPIRDDVPSRSVPLVTYGIIALNVFVFWQQLQAGPRVTAIVERYGMIPARITHPGETIVAVTRSAVQDRYGRLRTVLVERQIDPTPFHPAWTLLTCILLHGGWMHLIGNCWFLFIFGDNVEDRLGHALYLAFYMASGAGASLIHWGTDPESIIPTIGASGAIAGVMGAYFLLYPRAHVLAAVPIVVFLQIVVVPAYLFLGVWLAFQYLQAALSAGQAGGGGVAWWAHIGGFLVGGGLLILIRAANILRSAPVYEASRRWASTYRYRRR